MPMTVPERGIRLLVADSSPETVRVVAALLHSRGDYHYSVESAGGGLRRG